MGHTHVHHRCPKPDCQSTQVVPATTGDALRQLAPNACLTTNIWYCQDCGRRGPEADFKVCDCEPF